MPTLVLILFLAAILCFFIPAVPERLRGLVRRAPWSIWALPPVLTAAFAASAAVAGVSSGRLALLVLVYTALPVLCATGAARRPMLDFLTILLLWLPIEFGAGQTLVPRAAQGFLHSLAYAIAILLGLVLFLCYRTLPGMKFNLPRRPTRTRDLWLPLAGFGLLAPVLVLLGIGIGFLPTPHLPAGGPSGPAGRMAAAAAIIFFATALPEEILFRALIQNLLAQRFGPGPGPLLAASVIFGCAHLDNGPQPLPNWRYAILATIAGWAYGKVFEKSSTVLSSALLHTLVDWTKHFFF